MGRRSGSFVGRWLAGIIVFSMALVWLAPAVQGAWVQSVYPTGQHGAVFQGGLVSGDGGQATGSGCASVVSGCGPNANSVICMYGSANWGWTTVSTYPAYVIGYMSSSYNQFCATSGGNSGSSNVGNAQNWMTLDAQTKPWEWTNSTGSKYTFTVSEQLVMNLPANALWTGMNCATSSASDWSAFELTYQMGTLDTTTGVWANMQHGDVYTYGSRCSDNPGGYSGGTPLWSAQSFTESATSVPLTNGDTYVGYVGTGCSVYANTVSGSSDTGTYCTPLYPPSCTPSIHNPSSCAWFQLSDLEVTP
jgi:hypothetical protein